MSPPSDTPFEAVFTAVLWEHDGSGSWHFVTLPGDLSDDIDERTAPSLVGRPGFGSVRVEVTVGATTWRTSLFPDTKRQAYVLPMKRPVRVAEHLTAGEPVDVAITLLRHGAAG